MSENTEEAATATATAGPCNDAARKHNANSKSKVEPSPSTKEAYFASLNEWAKQAAQTQNAMAMFPYYLLANYPQLFQTQYAQTGLPAGLGSHQQSMQAQSMPPPPQVIPVRPAFNRFRILDELQQQEIIQRVGGGYEYVVAPFWKRAVAEAIDVFILFLVKIIVTFAIVNFFDLDVGFDINKDVMRKTLDDEDMFASFFDISMDFITLSSDLLIIELLTKLIVCCYEAIWTVWYNGATPGKSLMKIRIHYVEAVLPLQGPAIPQFVFQPQREPLRALLYPAETPTLIRAFMRALAKNLVMTLLFPICVVMIFFKNNRTAYDILTKTIVVETNANAIYRPQQPRQQR